MTSVIMVMETTTAKGSINVCISQYPGEVQKVRINIHGHIHGIHVYFHLQIIGPLDDDRFTDACVIHI